MKNRVIFWDEDTQIDFLSPSGRLYVPGAELIVPNLIKLTFLAKQCGIPVVASTDAHYPDDPEMATYPPHCLIGTPGQRKVQGTELAHQILIPNRPVQVPLEISNYEQIVVEKQDVDVFTNPNIEKVLDTLGASLIVLYGVVTEICVAIAARGLLSRGYKVEIVEDAIRAFDEAKGAAALKDLQQRGGSLVTMQKVTTDQRIPWRP